MKINARQPKRFQLAANFVQNHSLNIYQLAPPLSCPPSFAFFLSPQPSLPSPGWALKVVGTKRAFGRCRWSWQTLRLGGFHVYEEVASPSKLSEQSERSYFRNRNDFCRENRFDYENCPRQRTEPQPQRSRPRNDGQRRINWREKSKSVEGPLRRPATVPDISVRCPIRSAETVAFVISRAQGEDGARLFPDIPGGVMHRQSAAP